MGFLAALNAAHAVTCSEGCSAIQSESYKGLHRSEFHLMATQGPGQGQIGRGGGTGIAIRGDRQWETRINDSASRRVGYLKKEATTWERHGHRARLTRPSGREVRQIIVREHL